MSQIRPPFHRSLISSLDFFWYGAIFAFGCFFYVTDPEIAASVQKSPIMIVFILSIPGLIYLLLTSVNNFSLRLMNDGYQMTFSSLFKRISVPLSEIQDIHVTSPDLVTTLFSDPPPTTIRTGGRFRLYVGAQHALSITKRGASEPITLKIGPGWRQEDLTLFVQEMNVKDKQR